MYGIESSVLTLALPQTMSTAGKKAKCELPPCRVCKDTAAGFHYGANTCEACKGFFHRSLRRKGEYKCIGTGSGCIVGPGKLRSCPKCRYKRCIDAGMSKAAIKTGRYTYAKRSRDTLEIQRLQQLGLLQSLEGSSSSLSQLPYASPFPAHASSGHSSPSSLASPSTTVGSSLSPATSPLDITTFSDLTYPLSPQSHASPLPSSFLTPPHFSPPSNQAPTPTWSDSRLNDFSPVSHDSEQPEYDAISDCEVQYFKDVFNTNQSEPQFLSPPPSHARDDAAADQSEDKRGQILNFDNLPTFLDAVISTCKNDNDITKNDWCKFSECNPTTSAVNGHMEISTTTPPSSKCTISPTSPAITSTFAHLPSCGYSKLRSATGDTAETEGTDILDLSDNVVTSSKNDGLIGNDLLFDCLYRGVSPYFDREKNEYNYSCNSSLKRKQSQGFQNSKKRKENNVPEALKSDDFNTLSKTLHGFINSKHEFAEYLSTPCDLFSSEIKREFAEAGGYPGQPDIENEVLKTKTQSNDLQDIENKVLLFQHSESVLFKNSGNQLSLVLNTPRKVPDDLSRNGENYQMDCVIKREDCPQDENKFWNVGGQFGVADLTPSLNNTENSHCATSAKNSHFHLQRGPVNSDPLNFQNIHFIGRSGQVPSSSYNYPDQSRQIPFSEDSRCLFTKPRPTPHSPKSSPTSEPSPLAFSLNNPQLTFSDIFPPHLTPNPTTCGSTPASSVACIEKTSASLGGTAAVTSFSEITHAASLPQTSPVTSMTVISSVPSVAEMSPATASTFDLDLPSWTDLEQTIDQLVKSHNKHVRDLNEDALRPCKLNYSFQPRPQSPDEDRDRDSKHNALGYSELEIRLEKSVRRLVKFARSIPGFSSLPLKDRMSLIKWARLEFNALTCTNEDDIEHLTPDILLFTDDARASVKRRHQVLVKRLASLDLSVEEIVLVKALLVTSTDRTTIGSSRAAQSITGRVTSCLLHALAGNHNRPGLVLSRIVSLLTEVRTLSHDIMFKISQIGAHHSPLLKEMYSGIFR
ncbi:uncharacterized protein LOC101859690 [Aplysia californica]|uniref:Uncharacterized protein LOC101859690 n=1 Tax=Aplysia californica TaxID=6500 RepID=A0ABM0JH16_APLCA|nr:uncharacterized protein LOC101859690 [Aplysia californica]